MSSLLLLSLSQGRQTLPRMNYRHPILVSSGYRVAALRSCWKMVTVESFQPHSQIFKSLTVCRGEDLAVGRGGR